jgi:sugar phosphate permease
MPLASPATAAPRGASRPERVVFATLLTGYASLYLCRANVDAAGPLLQEIGYSKAELGQVASTAVFAYAIGKVILGAVGDQIGGKRIILVAMFGSIVATVCIGVTSGLVMLTLFAVVNRFFQSGGWGGLVHVVSRWFPPGRHGRIMGALSASYEIGNVCTLLLCGALVRMGLGWRALFLVNPALLAVMAVAVLLVLKGAPSKRANAADGADIASLEDREGDERWSFGRAFPWLAKRPAFWVAIVLSMLLTFVRTGFLTWTPIYLAEIAKRAGSDTAISGAMMKSAIFPAAGVIAAIATGPISDRFGPGRRAPVIVLSLVVHVVAVLALAHGGVSDTVTATIAIGVCGLFLLGPYSLMAGAITLDVAGKRAAATAAGVVDGAGYLGASLVGIVIGAVAEKWGWTAAFDVIAGAGAMATLVAAGWWAMLPPVARAS